MNEQRKQPLRRDLGGGENTTDALRFHGGVCLTIRKRFGKRRQMRWRTLPTDTLSGERASDARATTAHVDIEKHRHEGLGNVIEIGHVTSFFVLG
ncbi:MAG: hypothetical protein GY801_37975 [bacterium]|nr:hypothetical protein [bacterium]